MADNGGNLVRKPCRSCGRQFVPESLAKHEPICMKGSHSKRKVFDSTKMRVSGTDINLRQAKHALKKPEPVKKNNWRAKHEDFINAVRSAKGVDHALKTGGALPPPPPPSINPDYVQCPYCSRRFNEKAAERHISFCKEQAMRKGNKPQPSAAAKAKMDARTNYQAPRPKARSTGASPGMGPTAAPGRTSMTSRSSPGVNTGNVGRTPPGGAVGTRTGQPATRGRSTGTGGYSSMSKNDSSEGVPSPGSGRALRTGRGSKLYQEAKMDVKTGVAKPKSASRGRIEVQGTRHQQSPEDFNGGFLDEVDPMTQYNNSAKGHYSPTSFNHHYNNATNSNCLPKFCFECGTKFPVATAKFCCECGMRRMGIQ